MKLTGLTSLVYLQSFTVFSEYFISVSLLYVLVVMVLINYNVYGIMLQKALSECIALILLMSCYLMLNDDLIDVCFSFNNSIINDYLAFFTKFVICFSASLYFFTTADTLKEQKLTSFEYLLIILFAVLGLLLLCSSNDLLTAYLAIELSSLAFYMLAAFRKTSSYSVESGIKYFVIGAISSALFLLGSSFIYVVLGSIDFLVFYDIIECWPRIYFPWLFYDFKDNILEFFYCWWLVVIKGLPPMYNYDFAGVGLALILFSLFIKLALAPFHLWSLDVYEGSPTNSTFFFAVITKLSIFVLLIRLCYKNLFALHNTWQFYSLWVGLFSIFTGAFGGLKQKKLKTLLAYSSISHMGYLLLAFSTCTFLGVQMSLFYLVVYMISGLAVWYIILLLRVKQRNINKYNKELSDIVLLRKSNLALAIALSITMFSLAGIPPIVGFFAKFSIFFSVIGTTYYFVALVSLLCSVVSTFYYIRIIKILHFENLIIGKLYYPINTSKTIIVSLLVFSLMFLFINPTFLFLCVSKAMNSLDVNLLWVG